MRLDDNYNNQKDGLSVGHMMIAASFFVLLVLAIVLLANRTPKKSNKIAENNSQGVIYSDESNSDIEISDATKEIEKTQIPVDSSGLTSDDLDIWDEEKSDIVINQRENNNSILSGNTITSKEQSEETNNQNHTLIEYENGESEWVGINPYLTKNKYDYTGLVYPKPLMKYYENSQKKSYMGVDISKSQGFVDYNKIKKSGIEFVMICLGSRGYASGQLVIDENYANNMKGATDAGLYVGVYFFSQAITEAEAQEEAEIVIEYLSDYKISYPVVFHMSSVEEETSRTDTLTKTERTKIALSFMKRINAEGYIPMIYGNKQWLLKKFDLSQLEGVDVWLAQEKDIPDYPYKFSMWQYSTQGVIDGIAGNSNLNISFLDYSIK